MPVLFQIIIHGLKAEGLRVLQKPKKFSIPAMENVAVGFLQCPTEWNPIAVFRRRSSGAGLQWREELSVLLRAKDLLRDLSAGHAGLGHADQVVEVKTLGRGEPDKIYRGGSSHELLVFKFLQKQRLELVVGVIALHGATLLFPAPILRR
jgi:hypothetical protein